MTFYPHLPGLKDGFLVTGDPLLDWPLPSALTTCEVVNVPILLVSYKWEMSRKPLGLFYMWPP